MGATEFDKPLDNDFATINTNLGSPTSASGVTGADAFTKINTLNYDLQLLGVDIGVLNSKLPISYSKGAVAARDFFGIYGFITTSATYLALYVPIILNPDVADITNISITNAGIRISDGGYVIGNGADLTQYVIGAYVFKLQGLVRIDLEKSGGWGITNNTICIGNATLSFTLS